MTTAWFDKDLGVNVADFGADPFGNVNSTVAFSAAKTAAGASGTIHCPTGIYLIDWAARTWVGDIAADGAPRTTVRAAQAGSRVVFANTRMNLVNMIIDAAGICDYGIDLNHAHSSILWNSTCTRANVAGWWFNEPQVGVTWKCAAVNNAGAGFRIVGTNLWNYYELQADNNGGWGVDVYGHLSGVTTLSGQMHIFGAQCFDNALGQMRLNGVGNGSIGGVRTQGPGDGLLMRQRTHGISVDALRLIHGGDAGTVAIRVEEANMNVFRNVTVLGSNDFARVRVETGVGNVYMSLQRDDGTKLPIEFVTGGSFSAFDNFPGLRAMTAPTAGVFGQGSFLWNEEPTAGSPLLWRCTASGTPGTWQTVTK
jgi:hypothetical protein